jgi:putative ABC transport system permease protein
LKLRRISFSSIRQRKAKSALLVAGLVVGVTAVVALVSLSLAMQRDLSRKLQDYGTSIIVSGKSDSLALSYGGLSVASAAFDVRPLSAEDVARVRTIPDADLLGVVSPVLLAPVTTESQEVLVVGVNFPEQFRLKRWWGQTVGEVNQLVPFRGRKPAHPDEIVLGNLVAAKLQKPVGAPVAIAGRSFKVAAILSEQGSQEDSLVFADLARLQEATARPGAISLIEVGLKSQSVPVEKIVRELGRALPNAKVSAVGAVVASNQNVVGVVGTFAAGLIAIVVVVGSLIVLTTMMASVNERTSEIGLFRAIGFRRLHIIWIVVAEALVLSVVAGIIGFALGTLAALGVAARLPGLAGTVAIDPLLGLLAVGLALLIGLAGSSYPAWRASLLDPTEAFRKI